MLTDEVKIKVIAGRGGDGVVAFNKVKMSLGPTGGKGGNGGNIYFEGVSNLSALNKYKHKKEYYAENGQNGKGDNSEGHSGKDLTLTVPIGSVLRDLKTKEEIDIIEVGQKVLIAKGGWGGRGNFFFRGPTNTSPKEKELGKIGEEKDFFIELRFIADVGLIGLPSAGKSSLLNELTASKAKVGAYNFTTLEPNLGVMDGIILADIPGLIEGASQGRGLGIKFLRHIQRTKILVHCLSLESANPKKDYKIIRKELEAYNQDLIQKKEIILFTKSDMLDEAEVEKKIKQMKKINPSVYAVSIHDQERLEKIKKEILAMLKK
ncbi:MAG TPA: GTPase ObgE [Candidatus Moranbacteria bacterium]|nr:GTPase ObgE [Candidatus Moranbacteria bacterium]HAT74559.1 GTPase ObgE [Candidatus Moranbacteria bacterium]